MAIKIVEPDPLDAFLWGDQKLFTDIHQVTWSTYLRAKFCAAVPTIDADVLRRVQGCYPRATCDCMSANAWWKL